MSTDRTRQPKGVPVGGQFAATSHDEAGVTLTARAPALPGLAPYGEVPAPLETQTLADGSPAGATFEESYRTFFRDLDDHEAAHGSYEPQKPISEADILDLAGIGDANLGRHRGTYLERDDTGDPVIVVHTRNGGGNRECYEDDCDGNCTGCIQTDSIPALPTYLRDEDDDGDFTYANNYFRPLDPAAGLAAIEAEERLAHLNRLDYYRTAITDGTQPPWVVLSPVRPKEDRDKVYDRLAQARRDSGQHASRRRVADNVMAAIEAGQKLPALNMMRIPNEKFSYDRAVASRDQVALDAAEARTACDVLGADLKHSLPPTTAALVQREHARLQEDAFRREAQVTENEAKIQHAGGVMRSWAWTMREQADKADAAVTAAEEELKDFDWSASWPGAVDDCPQRP
ncbi:hypothetical protein [Arthrobacter sp. UYCo732]|uniref:hypothetical protein n=1 Tax=Arthrobacter sp. UYCo732 TaxID=3156336 RepID=UPI003395B3D0